MAWVRGCGGCRRLLTSSGSYCCPHPPRLQRIEGRLICRGSFILLKSRNCWKRTAWHNPLRKNKAVFCSEQCAFLGGVVWQASHLRQRGPTTGFKCIRRCSDPRALMGRHDAGAWEVRGERAALVPDRSAHWQPPPIMVGTTKANGKPSSFAKPTLGNVGLDDDGCSAAPRAGQGRSGQVRSVERLGLRYPVTIAATFPQTLDLHTFLKKLNTGVQFECKPNDKGVCVEWSAHTICHRCLASALRAVHM